MKTIEKVIKYEDYNYVEGTLQFKAYGKKTKDHLNSEEYSIDRISSVRLEVERKFLAPKVPPGINKQKVSTLYLPEKISTFVDGNYSKQYAVDYDEIIVDDDFVDAYQNIKGRRFFSTKNGSDISSTVELKVYALIKLKQQRTITEYQYEINKTIHGNGKIELKPRKEYYDTGDKVLITAIPDSCQEFLGWNGLHEDYSHSFSIIIANEDLEIEGFFTSKEYSISSKLNYSGSFAEKELIAKMKADRSKGSTTYKEPFVITKNKKTADENKYSFSDSLAGCWTVVGWIISAVFFLGMFAIIISVFGTWVIALLGIGILFWLISLIPRSIFSWRILQWALGLVVGLILISGIANLVNNFDDYRPRPEIVNPIPKTEENVNPNETIDYTHHIKWADYDGVVYETDLGINSDVVNYSTDVKNQIPPPMSDSSYAAMLGVLNKKSSDAYIKVRSKLDSILEVNSLSRKRYAEVMVSMIQHIPYYAVVDKSCNPFDYQDPRIRQLLQSSPCEPNQRFGIKTPAEFLKNLKGDCDTRTLFLYGLLKQAGYDVAIFGSEYYGHSVLGINAPMDAPHYKTVNNKRYYLWEVTSKDFTAGTLSPDNANMNYWKLNLN